jgi:hypothetical protein
MPKLKDVTGKQRDGLLETLKTRFEANTHRHPGLKWATVLARVESPGEIWHDRPIRLANNDNRH